MSIDITIRQAIRLWSQLEDAFNGRGGFDTHSTEVYGDMIGGGMRADATENMRAADALVEIGDLFERYRDASVEIDGECLREWRVGDGHQIQHRVVVTVEPRRMPHGMAPPKAPATPAPTTPPPPPPPSSHATAIAVVDINAVRGLLDEVERCRPGIKTVGDHARGFFTGIIHALNTLGLKTIADSAPPPPAPTPEANTELPPDIAGAIATAVCEAYEIGYAHGGNPWRVARNEAPLRVTDGWGQVLVTLTEQLKGSLSK